MNIKIKNLTGLALITLLTVNLMAPSLVYAGKGANRGYAGHGQHHRYYDRHHDHRRHSGRHMRIYNRAPAYYQQYYPQPQQYGYYPPAPVYVVPPQIMMGINTGRMDFMLRF